MDYCKLYDENRLLSKLAFERQVLGVHGAENRSVLDIHEDLSTGVTTQLPTEVEFRKKSNDSYIAYRKLRGKKASIVFFGGFASNMDGTKATAIRKFCEENDIALILFDYFGHGYSSGNFTDYTISDWQKNCVRVVNELTSDKQIIIGSSMGAWLMLLTALQFPEKISALIGISSAPDFTEDFMSKLLSSKQKEELNSKGVIDFISEHDQNCTYKITKNLIEDGKKICF